MTSSYRQIEQHLRDAIREASRDPFALLGRVSIGFEDLFADADSLSEVDLRFPFHNIIKAGENDYRLQLTLAGWSREEITVRVEEKRITIIGVPAMVEADDEKVYVGITKKPFERHLIVRPGLIVKEAWMDNGLLTIQLVKPTPVSTMREIPLTDAQSTFTGGTTAEEGEPKTVNLSEVPDGHELLTEEELELSAQRARG